MSQYTEEEQILQFKEWWQRNGKPLLIGAVLAVVLVLGWQFWQKQQANKSLLLSTAYQELLMSAFQQQEADIVRTTELVKTLEGLQADHAYTQYAYLILARLAVDEGRLDAAATELRKILAQPADEILAELAQQRLARVLAAQEQPEQALKLVQGQGVAAYQAARDELRGDILLQLGQDDEARKAYQKAAAENTASGILTIKLDNLTQKDA